MASTSQKRREYTGPIIFSHGFRVFFLAAGLWSLCAMALWVFMLSMGLTLPSRFSPLDWHQHEMLFGYTFAVLAGFLLTAVPNWTGRLPVIGWPTAGLAGLWALGRVAALGSENLPVGLALFAELMFSLTLLAVLSREVLASRNWRNVKVLVALGVFAFADALHLAKAYYDAELQGLGMRLGVAAIIWLITLIGGRVVPSFTRNWLVRQKSEVLPTPFARFDLVVIIVSTVGLLVWVVTPGADVVMPLAAICGSLHLARLYRWVGWLALGEPLVTVLHIAYLFVPVGFFMLALGGLGYGTSSSGGVPHGWTAGAVSVMTLAMMTRASLGHSGRMLTASRSVRAIYAMAILAAMARIWAEYSPNGAMFLDSAALLWVLAYGIFVVVFAPMLMQPRNPS